MSTHVRRERKRPSPGWLVTPPLIALTLIGAFWSTPRAAGASAAGQAQAQQAQMLTPHHVQIQYSKTIPPRPDRDDLDDVEKAPPLPVGAPTPNAPHVHLTDKPLPKPVRHGTGGGPSPLSDSAGVNFLPDNYVYAPSGYRANVMEPSEATAWNVVMYTGNWFASISLDGGYYWYFIDPYTTFPQNYGGFCCDQTVHYSPAFNIFIWQMQYVADGSGNNTQRIATIWTTWRRRPRFLWERRRRTRPTCI
jgi:hypothetical protein